MTHNRLPLELLSSIFSICVHDHRIPPERLSWVDKYWRYVAFNSSQLWSEVYYGAEVDMPRMLACLERSGTAPVNLEMNVTRTALTDNISAACLISMLSPHFHRVRAFHLSQYEGWKTVESPGGDMDDAEFTVALVRFLDMIHDPDQSLSLQEFRIFSRQRLHIRSPTFLKSASLQRVSTENVVFFGMREALDASSQTIVSLRIIYQPAKEVRIHSCIPTFRIFAHLRELEIELPDRLIRFIIKRDFKGSNGPVVLPSLVSLTVRSGADALLPFLVCPMLHKFSVRADMVDPRALLNFLGLHAETVASLDFWAIINRAGSNHGEINTQAKPTPFTALSSLSGTST
jgi:hypothetical protein